MEPQFATGGTVQQAKFGIKIGKRYNRFGVFAKVRPGFVSFGNTFKLTSTLVQRVPGGVFSPFTEYGSERKTHFATDLGGVLEFYPSRRLVVRFDAGDTIIHYGEHNEVRYGNVITTPDTLPIFKAAAQAKHNFQFTAGIGFRF